MRIPALLGSLLLASAPALAADTGVTPAHHADGGTAAAAAPAIKFPANVKTEDEKTVYALGLTLGKTLASFSLNKHEQDLVKQAMTESINNPGKTDVQGVMQSYGPKFREFLMGRQKKKSDEYLAKAAKEKGAQTLPSGLIFTSLTEGNGASPKPTDRVKVNYRGTLSDGTEFDSSYKRNQPAEFQLNQVIPCWTEGVQKMKVGGKAKLVCPSKIAYGDQGRPPTIPPASALTFTVELLSVSPGNPNPTPPAGPQGMHPGMPPGHP